MEEITFCYCSFCVCMLWWQGRDDDEIKSWHIFLVQHEKKFVLQFDTEQAGCGAKQQQKTTAESVPVGFASARKERDNAVTMAAEGNIINYLAPDVACCFFVLADPPHYLPRFTLD
jgi:hypothetical protein